MFLACRGQRRKRMIRDNPKTGILLAKSAVRQMVKALKKKIINLSTKAE